MARGASRMCRCFIGSFSQPLLLVLAVVAASGMPAAPGFQTAPVAGGGAGACGWVPGFDGGDLDGPVRALAVYDDGEGPALHAGGIFTAAGGVTTNAIARWSGSSWSALEGPIGLEGPITGVLALAVYDDGGGAALYAGGAFAEAGGVPVGNVAKWDGESWAPLTGPLGTGTGAVNALAVYDDGSGPALYVAGQLITAGGVTVNRIARWDGTQWSALTGPAGTGTDDRILALAVYDDGNGPALYAGGEFSSAGGVAVNHVARWDGTEWSALSGSSGTGANAPVHSLAVYDDGGGPDLYVGGEFPGAGGMLVNRIARWDGTEWSALSGPSGTGTSGTVRALTVYDDGAGAALYAGGDFVLAGGVFASEVAKWDGSVWSALEGPAGNGWSNTVYALAVHDDGSGPVLFAGGWATRAGGTVVNRIARWDGAGWTPLSSTWGPGVDGEVAALVSHDGPAPGLYAGGAFSAAGTVAVNAVARWDGGTWSPLSGPAGTGVEPPGQVLALTTYDDGGGSAVYAGGSFGSTGRGVAR